MIISVSVRQQHNNTTYSTHLAQSGVRMSYLDDHWELWCDQLRMKQNIVVIKIILKTNRPRCEMFCDYCLIRKSKIIVMMKR